ncbi:MAG: hypothetical protein HFE46_06370 [Clostridia bacterium]|nr:hypothetical protein [Clostridia bacterium]
MQKDKVDSLLGFAVKAGQLVFGADTLDTAKAKIYLIVMCSTTAENTKKKVWQTAEKKNIPLMQSENELQYAVSRKNCKVVAVTDKQMASAIIERCGQNYTLIRSEVK